MPDIIIKNADYRSPLWASNTHVQSLLATVKVRRPLLIKKAKNLLEASEEVIIDTGNDISLQSFYSKNTDPEMPLVVMIHGWEGSHESLYLLSSAHKLFEQGYHVLRLNLRDHGTSHHLNPELFHSNRLDEVVNAVKAIQEKYQPNKLFLVGFSLGGNFAVRIANNATQANIKLAKSIAICPAINPLDILSKLENGLSVYHDYFLLKWKRSLSRKQELYPDRYEFSKALSMKSMRQMTQHLLELFGDFATMEDYFDGYALTGDYLKDLDIPTTIIMTKDDPVIGFDDIFKVHQNKSLTLYSADKGGHCGFIHNLKLDSWADTFILEQLSKD